MKRERAIKQLIKEGILPTGENINALVNGVSIVKTTKNKIDYGFEVLKNTQYTPKKIKVDDFTEYFRNRYSMMKNLLFNRPQISNAMSISQAKANPTAEEVTIIAMVSDMNRMPNGSLRLKLEDLSDAIPGFISSKDDSNVEALQMLTLDEVVGLVGKVFRNTFYVAEVIWPDIPEKPAPSAEEEVYTAFSSDIHVGSANHLDDDFEKFTDWLSGKVGNDKQRETARRTKYIFFAGDLVDGVGIYPGQVQELTITDIYKQYDVLAKKLSKIPQDKQIILCPGNHDAVRIEEPQPVLPTDYAAPVYELPNVTVVPNPSYTKIHNINGQTGFDVLMYHGYSFDRFIDKIEGLRLAGGYDRGDLIQQFLLKRRHLSPTHDYNLTLPMKSDPLIISKVPDIVVSGHIHKSSIGQYKNCLCFSCSCWQSTTKFQEKMGHTPDPGHIPLLNLQTRKSTMLKFK